MPRTNRYKRSRRSLNSRTRKATFAKRVLSIVKGQQELKFATSTSSYTLNSIINATNGVYNIEPTISQGIDTSQRIGNSIRLMKCVVNLILNFKPDVQQPEYLDRLATYSQNALVRSMVLRQRSSGSGTAIPLNSPTGIFEFNNLMESSTSYGSSIYGYLQDVNRDAFTVRKDKRLQFSTDAQRLTTSGGTVEQVAAGAAGQFKRLKHTIRFGKNGKSIDYRTSGTGISSNFPYFMAMVAQNSYDYTQAEYVYVDMVVKWYYYDA